MVVGIGGRIHLVLSSTSVRVSLFWREKGEEMTNEWICSYRIDPLL